MSNDSKLMLEQIIANARFAVACNALSAAQDRYRLKQTPESLLALTEAQDAACLAMWANLVDDIAPLTSHTDLSKLKPVYGALTENDRTTDVPHRRSVT